MRRGPGSHMCDPAGRHMCRPEQRHRTLEVSPLASMVSQPGNAKVVPERLPAKRTDPKTRQRRERAWPKGIDPNTRQRRERVQPSATSPSD